MKLKDILESGSALQILLQESLPIDIAWDLKVFINKITPEVSLYEDIRKKRLVELGEEVQENGKPTGDYRLKQEDVSIFADEMNRLLEKEVKVDLPKIKISDLKNIKISAKDLLTLDWLIVE